MDDEGKIEEGFLFIRKLFYFIILFPFFMVLILEASFNCFFFFCYKYKQNGILHYNHKTRNNS